ncbi:MAG: GNAT family N-acetyltransferase [Marinovum sp.]|nr:GNAT family N-acetyltransferase [Marinovum sp.]
MSQVELAPAQPNDADAIWVILEPVFRAGDTYAIDPGISKEDALAYWMAEHVYIARDADAALGTFYIHRNRPGGGAHYCNCGFVTAPAARGRGVARRMLAHAQMQARALGFEAMVFNFVVSSNARAIDTWVRAGFAEVGRVPEAFQAPDGSRHDSVVMFKRL